MCRAGCRQIEPRGIYGHTLLELIIAVALGSLITLAALTLYRGQRELFEHITQRARRIDAGLAALQLISAHLRLAGFATPGQAITGAAILGGGSDSIEVRYIADEISTWATAQGHATDCLGQAIAIDGAHRAGMPVLAVNRFFVRVSRSTGEPELYCEGSGRYGVAQPVAEGIEHLRVRYWLIGASRLLAASEVPPAGWPQVRAVELCVVVRGVQRSLATSYMDCDGVRRVASDGLSREALTAWVALRNQHGLVW